MPSVLSHSTTASYLLPSKSVISFTAANHAFHQKPSPPSQETIFSIKGNHLLHYRKPSPPSQETISSIKGIHLLHLLPPEQAVIFRYSMLSFSTTTSHIFSTTTACRLLSSEYVPLHTHYSSSTTNQLHNSVSLL
jgi:hypothetical protein